MKLRPGSTLFFIFLLSAIHGLVFADADHDEEDGDNDDDFRLEMIHRYSPHAKDHGVHVEMPPTQQALIQELFRHDVFRHQMMSQRRQQNCHDRGISNSTRRMDLQTRVSMEMPMNAGWDYGLGQYLVKLKVGTPVQKFMVIANAGSELTWVKCKSHCGNRCGIRRGRINHNRVFNPDRSSTFKSVPCSSQMCKLDLANMFSLNKCPFPSSPCKYDYRYISQYPICHNQSLSVCLLFLCFAYENANLNKDPVSGFG